MKKFYQKKVRAYCRILFLMAFSFLLMSCLSWIMEAPSFALRGITLRPLSFTEVNLLFDLEVQNPNNFNLTFKSFEYTIYLKNEEIGNGRLEKELLVPSSSTTRIQVPVVARFKNLSGSLKAVLTEGELPYKIEGKAEVGTVLGSRKFPFSNEGRIN
ncbi:MAG: LEA type 2 family protein [Smithellaceae bacterium]